jgi:hypothetical protein
MLLRLLTLLMVVPVSAAEPSAEPEREARVVAACKNWWRPLDVNGPATPESVPGNGLCINGSIDTGKDAAILNSMKAAPDGPPLIVVIRSGGGEFEASMNVAEALQRRRPTVIANTVCASSCANYIMVAGARRIVQDDTLLIHHGGIILRLLDDQARPQIEALAATDPKIDQAAAMAEMRTLITSWKARQDAFMVRAGVKPEIFAWMDEANSPAARSIVARCPADSQVIQYSQAALARFGLTFDHYAAPRSQTEVDALIRKLGRNSKVCYWQE